MQEPDTGGTRPCVLRRGRSAASAPSNPNVKVGLPTWLAVFEIDAELGLAYLVIGRRAW